MHEFLDYFIVKFLEGKWKFEQNICCFFENYWRENSSVTDE